jgi:hypothetical protein
VNHDSPLLINSRNSSVEEPRWQDLISKESVFFLVVSKKSKTHLSALFQGEVSLDTLYNVASLDGLPDVPSVRRRDSSGRENG